MFCGGEKAICGGFFMGLVNLMENRVGQVVWWCFFIVLWGLVKEANNGHYISAVIMDLDGGYLVNFWMEERDLVDWIRKYRANGLNRIIVVASTERLLWWINGREGIKRLWLMYS